MFDFHQLTVSSAKSVLTNTQTEVRKLNPLRQLQTQNQKMTSASAKSKLRVCQKTVWFHYWAVTTVIAPLLRATHTVPRAGERSSFHAHTKKMDLSWNDLMFFIYFFGNQKVQKRTNNKCNLRDEWETQMNAVGDKSRDGAGETDG